MHERSEEDPVAQPPPDDPARAIALLRDQVDLLQIRSDEGRQPWFKQPSLLISGSALIVSLCLGLFTIYDQSQARTEEFIQEKSAQLGAVVDKLIENRLRTAELAKLQNVNDRVFQDTIINMSRYITLEEGGYIVNQLGDDASINALLVLGSEHQADSNFGIARDYYLRALGRFEGMDAQEKARNHLVHIVALRSVASLYALPDTGFQDMELSHRHWQAAVDLVKGRQDPYGLATLGYTLQSWAAAEHYVGAHEAAVDLLDQARAAYEAMDPLHPMRQQQLTLIDQTAAFFSDPEMFVAQGQALSFLGEWEVRFPTRPEQVGRAVAMPDPAGQGPVVLVDVFDRATGRLVRKAQGRVVPLDHNTLRIDWQGVGVHAASGQQLGLSGVTVLSDTGQGNRFEGSETELGAPALAVVLLRVAR